MLQHWFINSNNWCHLFIREAVITISSSVLPYLRPPSHYLAVASGWSKSDGKVLDLVALVGLKDSSGK